MLPVFLPFLFGGQRRVVFELDFSRPQVQSLLHAKPTLWGATDGSGNADGHLGSERLFFVQQV